MTPAQRNKKYASEAAFIEALREVLGLEPLIGKASPSITYHDGWPSPADGGRHVAARSVRR